MNFSASRRICPCVVLLFALTLSCNAAKTRPGETRLAASSHSTVRAAGGCIPGEHFWTGSACVPCTNCTSVGKYTAVPCSELQDRLCEDYHGKSVDRFWNGSACRPLTTCALGKYTAMSCSELQDRLCEDCQGKPAHASRVTRGNSSSTSCTWLCDAGFNENSSFVC